MFKLELSIGGPSSIMIGLGTSKLRYNRVVFSFSHHVFTSPQLILHISNYKKMLFYLEDTKGHKKAVISSIGLCGLCCELFDDAPLSPFLKWNIHGIYDNLDLARLFYFVFLVPLYSMLVVCFSAWACDISYVMVCRNLYTQY